MNIGIGIDVEEIARVKTLNYTKDSTLFTQLFTNKELSYCLSQAYPAKHLTGRFVAKEAVYKAYENAYVAGEVRLWDIEIISDSKSPPVVNIIDKSESKKKINASVSISYTSDIAMAMSIVSSKTQNK